MDPCPFCGSPVTTQIVLHGGTCPRCLANIPGEEAPTDPGEHVRAAHDRALRLRGWLRAGVRGVFALALLGGVAAVAAAVALRPAPEVVEIDFDVEAIEMPQVVSVGDLEPRRRRPRHTVAERSVEAPPESPEPVPQAVAEPSAEAATAGAMDLSLGGLRARRGARVVLDDPAAARQMIGEHLRDGIPELVYCYDRRLKQDPTVQGQWRLKFTVTPAGRARQIVAEALDAPDPALEACLGRHVADHWRFDPIGEASNVSKTLTFRPPAPSGQ